MSNNWLIASQQMEMKPYFKSGKWGRANDVYLGRDAFLPSGH